MANYSHPFSWAPTFSNMTNIATFPRFEGSNFRSGSSVRNYKALIAQNSDATSTLLLKKHEVRVSIMGSFSYSGKNKNTGFEYGPRKANGIVVGETVQTIDPADYVPADVQAAALSQFLNRADSTIHSCQSGVIGAEAHKTFDQLKRPGGAIRDAAIEHCERVKRRLSATVNGFGPKTRYASAASQYEKLLQVVQGSYLEWTFGIQPTLLDTRDAAKAAARAFGGASAPMRIHASQRWSRTGDEIGGGLKRLEFAHGVADLPVRVTSARSYHFNGTINYTGAISAAYAASTQVALGLDAPSFVPSLWEWLPYSWLADYFVNVNDVLLGLTFPSAGLSWACRSNRAECVALYELTSGLINLDEPNFELKNAHCTPSLVMVQHVTYDRARVTGAMLVPDVHFSLPGPHQLVNTAAVIAQQAICKTFMVDKIIPRTKIKLYNYRPGH